MKKVIRAALCGILCLCLAGCASDSEKQLKEANKQLAAGDYTAARTAYVAAKTPQGDEMAEYCDLMTLLHGMDWTDKNMGEYTYSDQVTDALKKIDTASLDAEYQAQVAAVQDANALYLKNVNVVDAAYNVVSAQYTLFDDYMSTLQTVYKRDSKATFPVGDIRFQMDEWCEVAQTAVATLNKTLPGIPFTGLPAYQKQAITEPCKFWYDAIKDMDDETKLSYNTYRFDWEPYYKPARTEISTAAAPDKLLDYQAVWEAAYAPVLAPAAEAASSTAAK